MYDVIYTNFRSNIKILSSSHCVIYNFVIRYLWSCHCVLIPNLFLGSHLFSNPSTRTARHFRDRTNYISLVAIISKITRYYTTALYGRVKSLIWFFQNMVSRSYVNVWTSYILWYLVSSGSKKEINGENTGF